MSLFHRSTALLFSLLLFLFINSCNVANIQNITSISTSDDINFNIVIPEPIATNTIETPDKLNDILFVPNTSSDFYWKFFSPIYSEQTTSIIEKDSKIMVDPKWKPIAIIYNFDEGTFGGPYKEYDTINYENDEYTLNQKTVNPDDITQLIYSMDNLIPIPNSVYTIPSPDHSVSWKIEFIGMDGSHLLLYSRSLTSRAAPWNIYVNGNLYMCWNEDILPILNRLFHPGKNNFHYFNESGFILDQKNYPFSGYSNHIHQLEYGFTGFVKIADAFSYQTTDQSIEGRILNTAFYQHENLNNADMLTELVTVQIIFNGEVLDCEVTNPEHTSKYWERDDTLFQCQLTAQFEKNAIENIPITLTFRNAIEELTIIRGELEVNRRREQESVYLPMPHYMLEMFETDPDMADLLQDHIIKIFEFNAGMNRETGSPPENIEAIVELYGQINVNGTTNIPYRIKNRLVIENGQVVEWNLSRQDILININQIIKTNVASDIIDHNRDKILLLFNETESQTDFNVQRIEFSNFINIHSECGPVRFSNSTQAEDITILNYCFSDP